MSFFTFLDFCDLLGSKSLFLFYFFYEVVYIPQ